MLTLLNPIHLLLVNLLDFLSQHNIVVLVAFELALYLRKLLLTLEPFALELIVFVHDLTELNLHFRASLMKLLRYSFKLRAGLFQISDFTLHTLFTLSKLFQVREHILVIASELCTLLLLLNETLFKLLVAFDLLLKHHVKLLKMTVFFNYGGMGFFKFTVEMAQSTIVAFDKLLNLKFALAFLLRKLSVKAAFHGACLLNRAFLLDVYLL